ncbi:MAG: response regulator [Anaerolineales bacterium]|nr:response regulator [Anaerolineales bacterium]
MAASTKAPDGKWILIVDDEESILAVLKNSLKKFGDAYQVVTANCGSAALEALSQHTFDLVVTDYRMEDMNGMELMEAVHSIQPGARVILITAYGNTNLETEARRKQAYHYLTKPLEINTFREIVQEALGNIAISRPGILILSDERYRQVNTQIERLMADVGAHCIFLTDGEGRFIARSGDVENLPLEQIACLVGGGVASLIEVGRIMDKADDTINLCYREGKAQNLYVVNIGCQWLLIIICDRGPYSSKLGSVWYFAHQAALELRQKLGEAEYASPSQILCEDMNQEFDMKLDQLFTEDSQPGEVSITSTHHASPASVPIEHDLNTADHTPEVLLTYEQAVMQGILPDEFTNHQEGLQ